MYSSLSLQDKIAQTVQLNGDLFTNSGVMNTGPTKELGFSEDFDMNLIGSIYNVNDPEKLKEIQQRVLAKSSHKIPLLFMSDVIYGFRTIFPMPLAQAGSYDFDLIKKAAEVTAKESYLSGLHVLFSPMLDLVRDPRWGRVMESPGEDVYTAKRFADSVIRGYQGENAEKVSENHVGACIKHFAAYGAPEAGREYNTVDMSNQRLFNEYLPPYQAAIEANTLLVMTAFNVLNGVPSTGNKWLNRDILRERFGFNGVLVSDYSAIDELKEHGFTKSKEESAQKALEAGVDFDMMTSSYANSLELLIKEGKVDRKLLDEAVWRIILLKNKLGLFENPYRGLDLENTGEILTNEAKGIATQLVEESCVLIKNENDILPIKTNQKVVVIGPYGESKLTLGFWASVSGKPQDSINLRTGLEAVVPKEQLRFSKGFNLFDSYEAFGPLKTGVEMLNGSIEDEKDLKKEAIELAREADIIILTLGEQFLESGEGASKVNLRLPDKQVELVKVLAELGKPIVGVLYTGRPLVLTEIEPYLSSLLIVWYPGTMGGLGIANLLSGKANPSAKLSMTFPRSEGQIPIYYAQNSTGRPLESSKHSTRFVSKYIDESNDPLFAFGTGLSYGNIESSWVSKRPEFHGDELSLKYVLKNTASCKMKTIAHLYVKDIAASYVQPIRKLIGSHFLSLDSSEEVESTFKVKREDLSFYDNDGEQHFESGEFRFYLVVDNKEKEISVEL
nr:glycoside hydrolase family 3 N-terminal domain-containing protein [Desemzia sp. RIT 804]